MSKAGAAKVTVVIKTFQCREAAPSRSNINDATINL
jgi:hypothetical protein